MTLSYKEATNAFEAEQWTYPSYSLDRRGANSAVREPPTDKTINKKQQYTDKRQQHRFNKLYIVN